LRKTNGKISAGMSGGEEISGNRVCGEAEKRDQ